MRSALPFILVGLAIFSAACVVFIAWELTSGKPQPKPVDAAQDSADVD